jgi:hypothetical protein
MSLHAKKDRELWLKDMQRVVDEFDFKRVFGVPLIELLSKRNQKNTDVPTSNNSQLSCCRSDYFQLDFLFSFRFVILFYFFSCLFTVFQKLVDAFTDTTFKTEGLFRLAASKTEVDALRMKIDDGK